MSIAAQTLAFEFSGIEVLGAALLQGVMPVILT